MSDIKPCPFCGEDKASLDRSGSTYWVRCGYVFCRAEGPPKSTPSLAKAAWNQTHVRDDVPVAVAVDMDEVAKLRQEVAQLQGELEVSDTLHDKYVRAALTGCVRTRTGTQPHSALSRTPLATRPMR